MNNQEPRYKVQTKIKNQNPIIKLVIKSCLLVISWLLVFVSWSFATTTFDPLSIGIGARALGMGSAYSAVAESADTIFVNPAGLGEIDDFEFTSMAGTILEEVNYTVLGAVYPLGNKTSIGLGYVSSAVSGLVMRDNSGTYLKTSDFSNQVVLISLGKKLSQKISLGANIKYYSQKASEDSNANGSAFNLDIGFLQNDLGPVSLAVVGQNLLAANQIVYQSGEKETLPQKIVVGTKTHLLGQTINSAYLSPIDMIFCFDADFNFSSGSPVTMHAGSELKPIPALTLRAGLDQSPKAGGNQNNLTAGVSLQIEGVGFHYAYHSFAELPGNASHFFSLTLNEHGWASKGPRDFFLGSL